MPTNGPASNRLLGDPWKMEDVVKKMLRNSRRFRPVSCSILEDGQSDVGIRFESVVMATLRREFFFVLKKNYYYSTSESRSASFTRPSTSSQDLQPSKWSTQSIKIEFNSTWCRNRKTTGEIIESNPIVEAGTSCWMDVVTYWSNKTGIL